MFFHRQFENFDPKSGHVPCYPFSYLPEIAYRARALLQYRTPEQITAIAKRINSEIEGYFDDLKCIAISELKKKLDTQDDEFHRFFEWDGGTVANGRWLFKEGMEEELDIQTAENTSEVDALKSVIEERDSYLFFLPEGTPEPEPEEYPEGKDYELFAVLALWLLADAINWPIQSTHTLSITSEYAIKAMDSVCYAEHLKEAAWLITYTKKTGDAQLAAALEKQKIEHRNWINYCQKMDKERAQKAFESVREKGVEKKKKEARILHDNIARINADLLMRPAKEGWTVDARANYIAEKVGRKESYVRKLLSVS